MDTDRELLELAAHGLRVLNAREVLERAALGAGSQGTARQFLKCLREGGMLVIESPLGVRMSDPPKLTPEQEMMRNRLFAPTVGQRCIFDARGGWSHEQDSARKKLTLESEHTVARVEVHSMHTRIWLVGHGTGERDWFNNMLFRPATAGVQEQSPGGKHG